MQVRGYVQVQPLRARSQRLAAEEDAGFQIRRDEPVGQGRQWMEQLGGQLGTSVGRGQRQEEKV